MSVGNRPHLLFLISADPRLSSRPAEAIRVAAGIGAWKKVDITVYLHGAAVRALGEWVDELRDEDNYTRYLPLLAQPGRPILVQAGAGELTDLGEASVPFREIDDLELGRLGAACDSVLRF